MTCRPPTTPSILFLRFLASQLSDMRLLVVGTYRDVALTPDHPLTTALVELTREPTTRLLTLPGLDVGSLGAFIDAETGRRPDARAVAAVWRETKGNPLFVREAVRLLSAEGRLDAAAELPSLRIEVPAGVREVIARRIGHLGAGGSPGVGAGMQCLARSSASTSCGRLRRMARRTSWTRSTRQLARASWSRSAEPQGDTASRTTWCARRSTTAWLAPDARGCTDGSPTYSRSSTPLRWNRTWQSWHFITTRRHRTMPSIAGKAIDYASRAGSRASFALAYEEAARHYPHGACAPGPERMIRASERRTDLLLSLGDVRARAGDLTVAGDLPAGVGARTPIRLAAAACPRGAGHRRPACHGPRPGNDTRLIPALQDALVLLGGTDDRLRVRLLTRLACAWRSTPEQRDQSAALSRQAVELARQLDDPSTLSYALAGRYWATWWPENPADRLPLAEEMVEVAEASGDAERLLDARSMLYIAYADLGRMAEARRKLQDLIHLAEEVSGMTPWQAWLGLAPVSLVALMDGDYAQAAELLEREAAYGFPTTMVRDDISAWRMQMFLLAREQGQLSRCRARCSRPRSRSSPGIRAIERHWPCCCATSGGRMRRASSSRISRKTSFAALYRDNEWLLRHGDGQRGLQPAGRAGRGGRSSTTSCCRSAGRMPSARPRGASAQPIDTWGCWRPPPVDLEAAVEHLEAGMQLNERMGARAVDSPHRA